MESSQISCDFFRVLLHMICVPSLPPAITTATLGLLSRIDGAVTAFSVISEFGDFRQFEDGSDLVPGNLPRSLRMRVSSNRN